MDSANMTKHDENTQENDRNTQNNVENIQVNDENVQENARENDDYLYEKIIWDLVWDPQGPKLQSNRVKTKQALAEMEDSDRRKYYRDLLEEADRWFVRKSRTRKQIMAELGLVGVQGDTIYTGIRNLTKSICKSEEKDLLRLSGEEQILLFARIAAAANIHMRFCLWFFHNHLRGMGLVHNSGVVKPMESRQRYPSPEESISQSAQDGSK